MNFMQTMYKVGYVLKKHAPTILTVAGIATTTAAVVVASKKAYDAAKKDIYKEVKEDIDVIKEAKSNPDVEYSEKDEAGDAILVVKKAAVVTAKQFWLPATLTVSGAALTAAGFCIISKRAAAAVATLNTVTAAFAKYRANVVADQGEKKDNDYMTKDFTKVKVNEETGEVTKEEPTPANIGGFDIIFDETHPFYKKNADYNRLMLKTWSNTITNRWHTRVPMTVNDVYKVIGVKPTVAGAMACFDYPQPGQVFNFGIIFDDWKSNDPKVYDFLMGDEPSVWLRIQPTTTIDKLMSANAKEYVY